MAPSFFKFLRDPFAPRLSLPPAFVREHLVDKIPNGPIIISASGGDFWTLKIEKIGDNHYFTNGWENVVKDIPLDFADFLIFHLVDPSTFRMTIFGANGCERILPQKELDGDEVDEDVANEFENVDDDHNDEDVAADDDDDYDEEEEEEKENDDQVNGDDEKNEDGDPSFTSVITKTTKSMLRLPVEFVALAGINAEEIMAMKNVDGEEWYMCLRVEKSHDTKRFYLTGWRDFQRENHVCEGDKCVFKFIRSEGKFLLVKVTKKEWQQPQVLFAGKRKRGRPAKQPKPSVKTPEVVKRKRWRPTKQPKPSVKCNPEVVKRKRGRPAKMSQPSRNTLMTEPVKKKRGRPARQPQPSGEILGTEAAKAEKEKGAASKAAVVKIESDEENM